MHTEFFWQSQQAIEKYLKAGLVINDISTRGLGHKLSESFEKHKAHFGDLVTSNFKKPKRLGEKFWKELSIEQFLKKIEIQGHPDSRYGLISWHNSPADLFMLDQLAYSLRRLTVGLDWIVGADWKVPPHQRRYAGMTFEEVLRLRPQHQPRGRIKPIRGLINLAGDRLEDVFFAWNFSQSRSKADLEKAAPKSVASSDGFGPFSNSQTYLMYNGLEKASQSTNPILIDGVQWFLDHFHLDKGTKKAFEERLKIALLR